MSDQPEDQTGSATTGETEKEWKFGMGRKPGSKNKNRLDIQELLKTHNHDPFLEIIKDLKDPSLTAQDRLFYNFKFVEYIAPKLKSVEVVQDVPTQMTITFQPPETRTADEIKAQKIKDSGDLPDGALPE